MLKVGDHLATFVESITVKSLFAAAATIHFDEILVQNLLSKNYVLLRLLFKGGYYLRAATNNDFTVHIWKLGSPILMLESCKDDGL